MNSPQGSTRRREDTKRLTFSVDQTVLNCFELICKSLHMRRDAYVEQVLPAEIERLRACKPGDREGVQFLEQLVMQKPSVRSENNLDENEMPMERRIRGLMREIELLSEKFGVPKPEMDPTVKQLTTTTLFSPVLSATTAIQLRETLKSNCVSPGFFLSHFLRGLSVQLLPAAMMASAPFKYKISEIEERLNEGRLYEEAWSDSGREERFNMWRWDIEQDSTEAPGSDYEHEAHRQRLQGFFKDELREILIENGKVTDLKAATSKLLNADQWSNASDDVQSKEYYQQIIVDKERAEELRALWQRSGGFGADIVRHILRYSMPVKTKDKRSVHKQ